MSKTPQIKIDTIKGAMISMIPRTVVFKYTDHSGTVSTREAEPYEIKDGKLFAHCLERKATRQFHLDRMENVSQGKPFTPRHPIKVSLDNV